VNSVAKYYLCVFAPLRENILFLCSLRGKIGENRERLPISLGEEKKICYFLASFDNSIKAQLQTEVIKQLHVLPVLLGLLVGLLLMLSIKAIKILAMDLMDLE